MRYDGGMSPHLVQSQLWRGIATLQPLLVEQALEAGADPNAVYGARGVYSHIQPRDTPLHALFRGAEKRMNARTGRLAKPSKGAMSRIVNRLLDQGADACLLDADDCTPLMLYCRRPGNELPVVDMERLITCSRSMLDQIQRIQGNTALHYACERQDKNKVKALLRQGADPAKANAAGKTPIWSTLEAISMELIFAKPKDANGWLIVDLLLAHGAQMNHACDDQMPWMAWPSLPLDRLSSKGADMTWVNAYGADALQAQLEKLEETPSFRMYAYGNLLHLLDTPGINWSNRTSRGSDAGRVLEKIQDEDMQSLLGQVRARVQSMHLDTATTKAESAQRSPRL